MSKYIIFAGVNGAGKTTFYTTYPEICQIPRINIDEIVRKIGFWKNTSDVIKASRLALNYLHNYLDQNITFNQETTLCGKSIINNIKLAKSKGYSIELYYVGLESVELAKLRVKHRVKLGGHGIPEKDIERRYKESITNLQLILPICDKAEIYDNSSAFQQIATLEFGKICYITEELPIWCKFLNNYK